MNPFISPQSYSLVQPLSPVPASGRWTHLRTSLPTGMESDPHLLCFLWPQDGEPSPKPCPGPDLVRPPSSPAHSLPTAWRPARCLARHLLFPQVPRSLTPLNFKQLVLTLPATLVSAHITSFGMLSLSLQPGVGSSPVFSWWIVVSLIVPLAQCPLIAKLLSISNVYFLCWKMELHEGRGWLSCSGI